MWLDDAFSRKKMNLDICGSVKTSLAPVGSNLKILPANNTFLFDAWQVAINNCRRWLEAYQFKAMKSIAYLDI